MYYNTGLGDPTVSAGNPSVKKPLFHLRYKWLSRSRLFYHLRKVLNEMRTSLPQKKLNSAERKIDRKKTLFKGKKCLSQQSSLKLSLH